MRICSVILLASLVSLLLLGGCFWATPEDDPDYLAMDDSRYPYAGLPRVVIETEDFRELRDRETEFQAYFQIYGDTVPETDVLELTVHGRGNSSFKMPKYGMKLEFKDKVSLFGMPKSRDWALIANFGDKTHLRNYMMTRLSEWLGAKYTPRMQFVELYLNQKYMGLYLLSETVKVAKNRVNIPENDSSFLFEREGEKKLDPPFVTTNLGNSFHIKSPKNLPESSKKMLLNHLNDFEDFLRSMRSTQENHLEEWIDLDDYILYYWVQEFSKNEDGNFSRSIFMTWEKGGVIHFGPLWDFDLAFGNESYEQNQPAEDWYIRNYRWNRRFFLDAEVRDRARDFWKANRKLFKALIDSIPVYEKIISKAIDNEYRRWPILQNKENWALKDPYNTYDEAIDSMKTWMERRYNWIDGRY